MKKNPIKYAKVSQYEVTSAQETENGGSGLRVSSSDSDGQHPFLDETKLESPITSCDEEVHFHNYDRTTYCCHSRRVRCKHIFHSKCELFLAAVVAVLAVILVIVLAHGITKKEDVAPCSTNIAKPVERTERTCTTRACIEVASRVALSLDETADPCNDFYQFSCGGWEKKNPLPVGHSRWGTFNELGQRNQAVLKAVLEANSTSNNSHAEVKARQYYKSCLDLDAINKLGAEPLVKLINEMGGWSIANPWNEKDFDLNATLFKFAPYAVFPFFSVSVGTDSKHSNSNVITVSESGLSLGTRDFYLNKTVGKDKILTAFHEYMTEIGVLLGGELNSTREQMLEVIGLETKLAEITPSLEEMRDEAKTYTRFELSNLTTLAPAVDWLPLIRTMFSKFADTDIEPSEPVMTNSLSYIQRFSAIVDSTPKRVVNNYAMWSFLTLFVGALGQPFIDAENKMHKARYGSDLNCWERWRDCVGTVDSALALALGHLFIEHKFDGSSKTSAEDMVREIKLSFNETLRNVTWMDQATKVEASQKAEAVEDMIGFPDKLLNTTYVNDEYKELIITDNQTYFEQRVNFIKYVTLKNLQELRKPVERNEWSMSPPTVNAYYSPNKNVIVFPAGILQPPFYSSQYPQSINYGGIGIVVGHELTHGFDDQGRQYDLHGNLRDWWEQDTVDRFTEKAQCMADQYSKFPVGESNVNGNLTLGENIADNGGVRLAFDAYKRLKREDPSMFDPLLPSLNYTHEQLFFIAFAQLWCTVSTPEYEQQMILTNVHSPGRYRVIGTVANLAAFSNAFQCPSGSPMNPEKKCTVW